MFCISFHSAQLAHPSDPLSTDGMELFLNVGRHHSRTVRAPWQCGQDNKGAMHTNPGARRSAMLDGSSSGSWGEEGGI